MSKYAINAAGRPTGFFFFSSDNADDAELVEFYTGCDGRWADCRPPGGVYDALRTLLKPSLPGIDVGASESYHMIRCAASDREKTLLEVRNKLVADGWKETNGPYS